MMNQEQQQALALAATVQALTIVHQVATEGTFDRESALPTMKALVTYSPDETISAYGDDIRGLNVGISQLKKLLTDELDRDIAQYLLAVVSLELKLVKNNEMRHLLQSEIQRVANSIENSVVLDKHDGDFEEEHEDNFNDTSNTDKSLLDDEIIATFADLYKQTASRSEPRIMIKGNHQYLQQENSANQIRTMLLAALRSAAFYRHNGGTRFSLMMKRKEYLQILDTF